MAFREIIARMRCDGCNRDMEVEIDPAATCDETVAQFAESALQQGFDRLTNDFSSVQDGQHLCGTCTSTVDEYVDDDERDATYDEIQNALAEADRVSA